MILEGLTLQLKDNWLCQIPGHFAQKKMELLEFQPIDDTHWRGVLRTDAGKDTKELVDWMQGHTQLSSVILLKCENKICTQDCNKNTSCSISFVCPAPAFAKALVANDTFLRMPVLLEKGTLYIRVVSTDEGLRNFYLALLPLKGCEVHIIKKFRQEEFERSTLTPKQEKFLKIAIDLGYYAVPRTITIGELAQRVGIAQSTLGEHLRKAEEHIITSYSA